MIAQDRNAIRILMQAKKINVDNFQKVEDAVQQGKVQLRKKSKTKNMIIKTGDVVKLTKKKKRVEQDKKEDLTTPKRKSPVKSPPVLNRKKPRWAEEIERGQKLYDEWNKKEDLTTPKKKSPVKSPPVLNRKKTLKKKSHQKKQWGIRINNKGQKILEAQNAPCIFPFSYKNKEYNNCIDTDSEGGPWCATAVSATLVPKNKIMIKYGYCPENGRQKNYLAKILQSGKSDSNKSEQGEINMEELIKKMPKYLDKDWITLKPDSTNTKIVIANPKKSLFNIMELYKKSEVGRIIETFSISFDGADAKKYIESPLKYNSIKVFLTTRALGKMPFSKSYVWKFSNIYSKVNPNKLIADKIKLGYDPLPW